MKRPLWILSGLSGSGKTIALHSLEDLNYYCIDNLPAKLLPALAEQLSGDMPYRGIAVGIDIRSIVEDLNAFPASISALENSSWQVRLLFLDADTPVLTTRYSETRRRHPLSAFEAHSLTSAIEQEKVLLAPLKEAADVVINTSEMNVHQLRRTVWETCGPERDQIALVLKSFAYKKGLPNDLDYCFDARCLPNPHWKQELRPYCGRDEPVRNWLSSKPQVIELLDDISMFLKKWLTQFEPDQRSYITVGIGCTGGKHRSVFMIESLADRLKDVTSELLIHHQELR